MGEVQAVSYLQVQEKYSYSAFQNKQLHWTLTLKKKKSADSSAVKAGVLP